MQVIICGAGQVGSTIAKQLAREGNDVTLIDQSAELVQKLHDSLDVKVCVGHASHPSLLKSAGLETADMIIAVTYSDEINMIACQVAHSLFNVPIKIARVRNQDYLEPEWKPLYSKDHMPIDVIISPEMEVAEAILRRLNVPGAIDMIPFADDKIRVLAVRCEENSHLYNLPLTVASSRMKNMSIIGIFRGDEFCLPKPEMVLNAGDVIHIVCMPDNMKQALSLFGHEEQEARSVVILGGGNIGLYIAKTLEIKDPSMRVKLIELDENRAKYIAEILNSTTIIFGSGLDREILTECDIESTEAIIAVTNDDKVNILSSLLAKRSGCSRSISLVNNDTYIPLLGKLGVDVTVSPKESTISSILQHVRRGKIRTIHSIHDGAAELIEAEVGTASPLLGKVIKDIKLPKDVTICAISHNDNFIIPKKDDIINEGDSVLILSLAEHVKKVEKFFSFNLDLF